MACTCSWDSRFHGVFRDLGECLRLILGFLASTGLVIYFVFDCIYIHILYWVMPFYLCCRVPRVVQVLCLWRMFVLGYFIFCTYTMPEMCSFTILYHAWPTLRGCLVSRLYTQPPGFTTQRWSSSYHVYMYTCVVLIVQAPLYWLWVSTHSRDAYPLGYRPCTLIGFVVATESALRPRIL